ncbi:universal stress protein UspA-like protein [Mycolicibacterium phlei]|jgi:nucleotide-binding universal stress UspA family protein|uniref:Universal stress protein n=1 Tax=Mycolicibacterium phlei DSM 43239 = CCUG 21000 TaxID=1226750 RepID=A0A5N5UQ94_MYCPH|nr:universal stress protein [Mycolicibacterium phlei]VEG08228.1 universal stress protein UspA-like protein [Mycobacteroides chelonae]AMO60107.1 Universal stress protein family protein [Mycolicibacterium phlei]EID16809.1 universal stress protein UspA-like protein [Mycolicibacterium phlei RIVM601174]KAB7751764.1 universal stress protein [Mycolicibacterium phlei DSM 43239 = CCUG 21000]KXW60349.1 universal stress protein [Mycolicibacterium phlei DSM 43239 = CCUG 21000]
MTVAVGFLAGKGDHSELYLAVEAARTLNTSLTVVSVVPRPWLTPSKARIDAEYAAYAEQLAAESARAARECIAELADGIHVGFHKVAHRSVSGGLIEAATELDADVLVLGSAADGPLGRVMVGSTADRLLHSSPVPVAIAPQGYRGSNGAGLSRITCAYPATAETVSVVRRVSELAARLGVPMRVLTFAVRGRTMYPPEVGLRAEDSILEAWTEQAREALDRLRADGVVGPDVELEVVAGDGWAGALANAHWRDGELLALGTTPTGAVARVFLGSRGTKIVRYSPVPVLVLPG